MKKRRFLGIYLVLLMLTMTACGKNKDAAQETLQSYEAVISETLQDNDDAASETVQSNDYVVSETLQEHESALSEPALDIDDFSESEANDNLPIYGEYYYDLENVVLYLDVYDELPLNYITKSEAQALGWNGGSVEKYKEGAAIGGDRFGNRERLLPDADGRSYTECDIDTNGYSSRGSRRLVFSDDGLYFYTADHYETFSEVIVTEDYEVIW